MLPVPGQCCVPLRMGASSRRGAGDTQGVAAGLTVVAADKAALVARCARVLLIALQLNLALG